MVGTKARAYDRTAQAVETEAQEIARLQRRYRKAPEQETDPEGEEALAQCYEALLSRYTVGIAVDSAVPGALQRNLRGDLLTFTGTAALGLARATLTALDQSPGIQGALDETQKALVWQTGRLSNILGRHDENFRDYLGLASRTDYCSYVFLSERGEHSCHRCTSLHGRLLTREELAAEPLLPPLHINCQCRIVAIDNRAEALYNLNRERFLQRLDRLFDEAGLTAGGIYTLGHDGLQAVSLLTVSTRPAVWDRTHSTPGWYAVLAAWAEKFGRDAAAFGEAFLTRWKEIESDARAAFEEGQYLLGTLYGADFLAFGLISGLYENLERQYALLEEHRDLPHLLNFFLQGLPAVMDDALHPEEPLSFQHVVDIIGVVTVLAGAAKVIGKPGTGGLESAPPAAGLAEISLEEIAKRSGKVQKVLSADELNAAYLKLNPTHEAPYLPGTKIYHVVTSGETKFVRVYGEGSEQAGRWVMNADDIKGLTKEQIKDQYSLPPNNALEDLCDVIVPEGTIIEISYAGPAFVWNGGGVQYKFISKYMEDWFINSRSLS